MCMHTLTLYKYNHVCTESKLSMTPADDFHMAPLKTKSTDITQMLGNKYEV